ncbi:bone morphogenetic protein receptor type-2-like [Montipora foliosa]|uniref:bone morphogenetic protein receptor type-2-like n=1 Tax=Montipora foliosa TaxID=591990 RepID=UPI0035F18C17
MARHFVNFILALFICFSQDCWNKVSGLKCNSYHPTEGIYNGSEKCTHNDDHVCFVLWRKENIANKTSLVVIRRGCFHIGLDNHLEFCRQDCIQNPDYDAFKSENVSGFCCCSGDLCNTNFTAVDYEDYESTIAVTTQQGVDKQEAGKIVIIAVALVIFIALFGAMAMVLYLYKFKCNSENKYVTAGSEEKECPNLKLDLTGLQIEELVGQGRYGCVWRGYFNGDVVAVKTFPPEHRHTWKSEKDVFETHLSHPSILKFHFAAERQKSNGIEYILVTEYHSQGSLLKFLKSNTVSWREMCVLGHSLAAGLAYLHNDDDHEIKPCFVHRDVSSKNVLVSNGLTCVLSDFGFAMKMPEFGASRSSDDIITEVGTLRYMAPEVLDGALNLRECEASLKEIDVYAMSLVIWEIAMRCSDIYGKEPVSDYKPPFEAELGPSITSEHIRDYVARQKRRPGFPDVWKNNHPGLRTLKETIEDCWDQDGDARLSALCVKERFSELLKDFPDGLSSTSSFNPVRQIVQNYPVSNSQSPLGSGKLVTNSPPPIIATQLWPEKSSNQGINMTTV